MRRGLAGTRGIQRCTPALGQGRLLVDDGRLVGRLPLAGVHLAVHNTRAASCDDVFHRAQGRMLRRERSHGSLDERHLVGGRGRRRRAVAAELVSDGRMVGVIAARGSCESDCEIARVASVTVERRREAGAEKQKAQDEGWKRRGRLQQKHTWQLIPVLAHRPCLGQERRMRLALRGTRHAAGWWGRRAQKEGCWTLGQGRSAELLAQRMIQRNDTHFSHHTVS